MMKEQFKMMSHNFPNYITALDIAKKIKIENLSSLPKIIISIAPVRSGTTATLRLYAESGIKSYRQPFKSIYRQLAQGSDSNPNSPSWTIPDDECIYVKETLGPHNIYESLLNPIDILFHVFKNALAEQYSGRALTSKVIEIMQSKIHLVVMGRNPIESWYSNLETYNKLVDQNNLRSDPYYASSEEALLENFIIAYQQVEYIRQQAKNLSIPISYYVYEANKYPQKAFSALFKKLGVNSIPKVSGWTSDSLIGGDSSNIFIISDFDNQKKAKLHEKLNQSDGICYFERKIDKVSSEIQNIINRSGLFTIYSKWCLATEKDLEISLCENKTKYFDVKEI